MKFAFIGKKEFWRYQDARYNDKESFTKFLFSMSLIQIMMYNYLLPR